MVKEKLFVEYYNKLFFITDQRVVFNETEKNRINLIKDELKKYHNEIFDICEEIWTENDLPDHEYINVFVSQTKQLTRKLDKLEKEFIKIQLNVEQRFMSNKFGNNTNEVITDAKEVIDSYLKENNSMNSINVVHGENLKVKVQGIYDYVLYSVRMHRTYLIQNGRIQSLLDIVSDKVRDWYISKIGFDAGFLQINEEMKKSLTAKVVQPLESKIGVEMVLQSTPLAILAMLSSRKHDNLVIERDGLTVSMNDNGQEGIEINSLVLQFIDMLIIEFNNIGRKGNEINFPVSKYMERRGIKSVSKARDQIKKISLTIYNLNLSYEGKGGSNKFSFDQLKILNEEVKISKGNIRVKLTSEFCAVIKKSKIMPYPIELFRFDETKNPHSYYLLRRIIWHKNINFNHKNANIISIDTLINACPNLQKYENIVGTGQINQRIIKPFEQGMNSLVDTLSWEYYLNDKPFSKEVIKNFDYYHFSKLMVHITWVNDIFAK